jgi:hypothetical protein
MMMSAIPAHPFEHTVTDYNASKGRNIFKFLQSDAVYELTSCWISAANSPMP